MSEMRYRRQIRSMAEMAPQPYHQQQLLWAMLESQLPVQTQLEWVLARDDWEAIEHAVFVATQLTLHAIAPAVIKVFERCPDTKMQSWWLTRFGVLEHPSMDHFLLSTLQGSLNADLRKCAAVALRDGKRPNAVAPLLTLALNTDEPIELRGEALEALAYQGNESLLPHILPFLKHKNPTLRWDALYAVGHLGNLAYASYVEPLLSDTTRVNESAIFPSIGEDAREILERWRTSIHLGGITWQVVRDLDE